MEKAAFRKRSFHYLGVRFVIFAALILLLYFFAELPLSYTILFVLFLVIKLFVSPDKILRIMQELFPRFKNLGINSQRFVIIIFYLLILFGLKAIIIDFVFEDWLGLHPDEDLTNYLQENGVTEINYLP